MSNTDKKCIAILTGGTSTERDVSLWSADYIEAALQGRVETMRYVLPEELDRFLAERHMFTAAIPVMHGRGGEDGAIQGLLKSLGMPCVFSDVAACAVAMDKRLAKQVVAAAGVRTPESIVVRTGEIASGRLTALAMTDGCVVKPLDGGSTIGVTVVRDVKDLPRALEKAFETCSEALVESFVEGREFTVAVVDDQGEAVALPVIEIVSKDGFFDFESKYVDGKMASEICPAEIPEALRDLLQDAAVRAHCAIGARHASRSDFIVDASGQPWFLELNAIPGMTKNSLLPKAVRQSGRDFVEVLAGWIEETIAHPGCASRDPEVPRL